MTFALLVNADTTSKLIYQSYQDSYSYDLYLCLLPFTSIIAFILR